MIIVIIIITHSDRINISGKKTAINNNYYGFCEELMSRPQKS